MKVSNFLIQIFICKILSLSNTTHGQEVDRFYYLNDNDKKSCNRMFENSEIKYDKTKDLYFKESYSPLTGNTKSYTCNNPNKTSNSFISGLGNISKGIPLLEGGSEISSFNKKTIESENIKNNELETTNQQTQNNQVNNQNIDEQNKEVTKNEKDNNILGFAGSLLGIGTQSQSATSMQFALINLNKAQISFLEALDEDELALATKNYVANLQSGKVLGDDDMEKFLFQSKENQKIINEKMLKAEKLSSEAKIIFAQGIPYYSIGVASLVSSGFSVSNTIDSFSGGISGAFSAVGLAITAKDALTAIPLFFSSSSKIITFAKQNDINTDELEKAKDSLGN